MPNEIDANKLKIFRYTILGINIIIIFLIYFVIVWNTYGMNYNHILFRAFYPFFPSIGSFWFVFLIAAYWLDWLTIALLVCSLDFIFIMPFKKEYITGPRKLAFDEKFIYILTMVYISIPIFVLNYKCAVVLFTAILIAMTRKIKMTFNYYFYYSIKVSFIFLFLVYLITFSKQNDIILSTFNPALGRNEIIQDSRSCVTEWDSALIGNGYTSRGKINFSEKRMFEYSKSLPYTRHGIVPNFIWSIAVYVDSDSKCLELVYLHPPTMP